MITTPTLYVNQRVRCLLAQRISEHFKLGYKFVNPEENTDSEDVKLYQQHFPLKKVPTLVDVDAKTGNLFKLTEVTAILYYLLEPLANEKKDPFAIQLLGNSVQTRADVFRWMSFFNSDLQAPLVGNMNQIRGKAAFNKPLFEQNLKQLDALVDAVLTPRLTNYTYLVGEDITIADFFAASWVWRGFGFVWNKSWSEKHPALWRWFNTVINHEFAASLFEGFTLLEATPMPASKKKETKPKKEQQPKKEVKKETKPVEEEGEQPAEKKAKHPLEALGKPTKFVLDEWKRQYSNNDTRPVALPWFFENFDASEYSIWKVDYKYNDELTMTFMSNNLVGGFFNRLTGSVKYMFGCLVVYGENNNNGIVGAVLVRGQDFAPAFNVAPDWESYAYTKLDASKEEDKKFIENMWAWDEPVVVNGESKEIVDGKVLK
ncbi:hypothetical protein QEN19_002335 [Hanseniaspora menglaensis]